MPIRLKVARTAQELDDVFRLRHDVYVAERGKFSDRRAHDDNRIVDHFDTLPGVANVVAYDGTTAVASFRVNKDSPVGLPPEKYYDFSAVRRDIEKSSQELTGGACIVSGSMLAIRKNWRHRRNVVAALFKTTTAVMHGWGATHVFGTASAETFSLWGRLGFEGLAEPRWVESVGDSLVPMSAPFDKVYNWAFGASQSVVEWFWLDNFRAQFDRILLSPGEVLFRENDGAEHAYAVDRGGIAISRRGPDGKEVIVAQLPKGALFGELAIFDGESRSATATATMKTEVVAIGREQMLDIIRQDPGKMDQLLSHFARRLRETDHLAMVQAFAPQTGRVVYALDELWNSATPRQDQPMAREVHIGAEQIARKAAVRESEVLRVLEMRKATGGLDYGDNLIRFHRPPAEDKLYRIRSSSDVKQ